MKKGTSLKEALTEKEAEDFLEKHKFKVVKRVFIKSKSELNDIENKIKFPWVMKISSRHIVHKTQLGGTILNIKSIKQAEKAFDKLKKINDFEGILVQEFIPGKELILGLKSTPEFGLVIMVGAGGTEVEKIRDVSFRVPPITESEAEEMIKELRVYNQIKNCNIKEIEKCLLLLSRFAERNSHIKELDINPLIINKKEAVVVDARIL
jgi:succinyl-CoA synthetase beta subunit